MVPAALHHRLPLLTPISGSPEGNHLRPIQYDVVLNMRFRVTPAFSLRGSFDYHTITPLHCPRSRLQPATTSLAMATTCDNPVETAAEDTEKEKEEDNLKKMPSLPPPPEKPEPGDCCGSGCVRCVWDVYYEELEEYNKLCASISGESKSN